MEKMEEMQAAELARHRVDQGAGGYYAKIMDKDQIIARRAYMRSILRVSFFWCTMSNAQLDNMRLCKAGDDFIVEDKKGEGKWKRIQQFWKLRKW